MGAPDAPETATHVEFAAPERNHEIGSDKMGEIQTEIAVQHLTELDFALLSREAIQFKSRATFRLCLVLLVQGIAAGGFGVDNGIISGLVAMPQFQHYFDLKTSGSKYGLIVAAATIGNGVASCFIWTSDIIGRRGVCFTGCILIIIGTLIQSIRPTATLLFVGRLFTGGGGALAGTVAPMYMNEISPTCWRGFITGLNAASGASGTILIGLVVIGTSFIKSNWSWHFPLIFQLVLPTICAVLIYPLTPESPRYLVSKGRIEEARRVVARYHTTSEDINSRLVAVTIQQIEESLNLVEDVKPWDFSPFYNNKVGRYRLFLIFLFSMFQQWNGTSLFQSYLPAVLSQIGIEGTQKKLGVNLGFSLLTAIAAVFGAAIFEKFNRRTLLVSGTSLLIIMLALMTIFSSLWVGNHRAVYGYFIILWVFLFAIFKGVTITPMHSIYPNECLHYSQRAKGMGLYSFFQAIFGTAITYGASVLLAMIGWKIYLIFIGINLSIIALTLAFFPEFRNLSLEEIDLVFETPDTKPVKLSKQLQKAKRDQARAFAAGEVSLG